MTTTYSVTRDQIILAALRKLSVIEPADTAATIESSLITNAAFSLNLMLKDWMTDGIKLWTVTEYTLPLTTSKSSYTIGPAGSDLVADKPLRLVQAWLRNTTVTPNIDTPLQIFSKQEYNILGAKGSTGVINSVFLDPGVTASTLYTYVTPDAFSSATYQLHFVAQRPIQDLNASGDVLDFPNEWYRALLYGLADELAIDYEVIATTRQEIAQKAQYFKNRLEGWDVEYTSSFFTPDARMRP